MSSDRSLWKNRPTLGQIISGTKCDRDKQNISTERGCQSDRVEHKKGPNRITICQEWVSIEGKFLTIFKYGSAPPPRLISFFILSTWIVFHVDFNTSSTLPCLKHYSSSCNEETYEIISNLMYNFIPKCVFNLWKFVHNNPIDSPEYSWIYYAN